MNDSLIIGASGQVGEHIAYALKKRGRHVITTHNRSQIPNSKPLDICKPNDIQQVFESAKPAMIYLTAALTNVDYCEQNPSESYEINVTGVKNIVAAVNHIGARLVYFSSDYIFDGKSGPYDEDSTPNPISEYGKQKLIAEHHIALFSQDYLIIRTTVVFGWEQRGKNFVMRLIKALQNNQEVRVPLDQIGNPTYSPNLAEASIELAESSIKGVFNIVGPELSSRYEFACEAARVFNLPVELIRPVKTSLLNQPALRPLNAGLKTDKAAALLKLPLLGYRNGLKLMADTKVV